MTLPELTADWRGLRALCYYRWAVAIGVSGVYLTGRIPRVLTEANVTMLGIAGLCYLLFAVVSSAMLVLRRPSPSFQTHLNAALDLGLLGVMVYAAKGIDSGLGLLLITPAAGAATLTSVRLSALLAAIAALAILGGELLRQIYHLPPEPDYAQAGLLGVFFFLACISANTLAQRARSSEATAARSQLDLENLAQLNEHIIARLSTGVLIVDDRGRIRLANDSAGKLLGTLTVPRERLLLDIAPSLSDFMHSLRAQPHTLGSAQTLDLGERRITCRGVPLRDSDPPALMMLLDDAAQVESRAQQIKLASLGRLTASIAHEIRNPLSAIHQAQQLLQTSELADEPNRRLLDIIQRHSLRINQIVEDVLSLSRREPVNAITIPLLPFIRRLAQEYSEANTEKALEFDIAQLPAQFDVRFDPEHLRRILTNLWDNACEHASDRATIHLRCISPHDGRRPYLEVRDNGPGIPTAIADKIFEPFFTTRHGGVGLGLYIVRELCELNSARIKLVHSDTGTSFRILFGDERAWLA